ncbi:MAG: pimeloyl-ACP methyl ester carboxylesterase [Alphaproteobacteria bacterium]|jgi:pimeloyl-ACP methyl ester carboxylesterase
MAKNKTVLALPGLLCDAYVWQQQATALADIADFLIPEFDREDSLEAMARTALDLCDGKTSVIGHSMGGRAAMALWRLAPDRVERLALLDTGAQPRRDGEEVGRMKLVALAREQGMAALADAWLPPMVHPNRTADDGLLQPLREMVQRKTPEIFANQQNALLNRPDAMPALASITVPTLVGVGREDLWSPVAQHEEMVAAIPGAKLVIFEESGHMSTVENAPAVTAALRDWLTN